MQGKALVTDSPWPKLASRAMRVLLARKDASYSSLATELSRLGISESARSVEGKIQRGTFRLSFFLQSLVAVGADYPEHWSAALNSEETWEERSSEMVKAELALQPWVSWTELAHRLSLVGEDLSADYLATQVTDGTLSATLFLQCATVCGFRGVDRFLDASDLRDAANLTEPNAEK